MILRILFACSVLLAGVGSAAAGKLMTDWSVGHKSKARLLVGALPAADGRLKIYAGVEVALDSGWKTYWRHPGDAGGVPPYFDWSKSQNVKIARQMFPAPARFRDVDGMSIGYKTHVVLPVEIEVDSTARRIGLAVDFQYGVCREICIPAQARLALAVTPNALRSMPPQLVSAIARVPRLQSQATEMSPRLARVDAQLTGAKPAIAIDVAYPGGAEGGDVFVEAGGEIYLPMTQKLKQLSDGTVRYVIDLSKGVDVKALAGKELQLTLVSAAESVQVRHRLP